MIHMTLTTILLNPQEKYITYLDPERASFEETQEADTGAAVITTATDMIHAILRFIFEFSILFFPPR